MAAIAIPIRLKEYQPCNLPGAALTDAQGEALWRTYGKHVAVEFPSPRTDRQWRLTNEGWAGFIPLDDGIGIELRPKVELGNLFRMMEYAYRIDFNIQDNLIGCESLAEFYERLANILARRVLDRSRKGLYRAYLAETDRLAYVRGRLDVSRAVCKPWDVYLNCHFEEHTADLEENRILAWTLFQVIRSGTCTDRVLPTLRQAYYAVRSFVTPMPASYRDCVNRVYNRLNVDYHPMHALCRFFLEHTGPTHNLGGRTMLPFLIDMAALFELFVAEWLKANLPAGCRIKAQEHVDIDRASSLFVKPDLTLYDSLDTPQCVLDTKYKAQPGPNIDDISQVITYAHIKRCHEAVLIYPTELEPPTELQVDDIRVRRLTFRLDGNLEEAGLDFRRQLFDYR